MRAVLILATFLPIVVVVASVFARAYLREMRRSRHIDELERENERLDNVIRPTEKTFQ